MYLSYPPYIGPTDYSYTGWLSVALLFLLVAHTNDGRWMAWLGVVSYKYTYDTRRRYAHWIHPRILPPAAGRLSAWFLRRGGPHQPRVYRLAPRIRPICPLRPHAFHAQRGGRNIRGMLCPLSVLAPFIDYRVQRF